MKVYPLSLTRDYCRGWGLLEAVRELIQNAIDSEEPFEWQFLDFKNSCGIDIDTIGSALYGLMIRNKNTTIPISSLLLGSTTKTEQAEKIGSFGEGFKIALLVLAREGYKVEMYNGHHRWTPEFQYSELYEQEQLCIVEEWIANPDCHLTFQIDLGLEAEIELIKETCLLMQENLTRFRTVPQGRILFDRPGKLYVNSLYVCDTQLHYGYDVLPSHIALERDRQTVSDWDLKLLTKDMWFASGEHDMVAQMIEQKVPDLEWADIQTPTEVSDACLRYFWSSYPEGIAVTSQQEADRVTKVAGPRAIFSGRAFHSILGANLSYRSRVQQRSVKPREPAELLQEWFELNRKHMRRRGMVAMRKLIAEVAPTWKL